MMIDMHCHILPGIDDGAKNLEQAVELCMIAENQNITSLIATPHFIDYDNLDSFLQMRETAYNSLVRAKNAAGLKTEIFLGAELFLDDHLYFAPNIDELTLNSSRYILGEFSLHAFDAHAAVTAVEELIARGYVPVIAHPERYITFQRNPQLINDLAQLGVLFQINADSLLGLNGPDAFELSCAMCIENLVDLIGSDAHSPSFRANDLLDKSQYFPEIFDFDQLDLMLKINPRKIIEDKDILPVKRGLL